LKCETAILACFEGVLQELELRFKTLLFRPAKLSRFVGSPNTSAHTNTTKNIFMILRPPSIA